MSGTDGKLPLEKFLSLRICSVFAIVLPVVFACLWVASATIDGDWTFGEDSLSRMGISENPVSAALFNYGCIFCGLMGALIGVGTALNERGFNLITGIAYSVGMVFLMLVGVFPMDLGSIHYIVASTFGVFMFIVLVFNTVTDYLQKWHPEIDIVIIAVALFLLFTQKFELWEPLLVIIVMIWTIIHGIKMRMFEDAFPLSFKI